MDIVLVADWRRRDIFHWISDMLIDESETNLQSGEPLSFCRGISKVMFIKDRNWDKKNRQIKCKKKSSLCMQSVIAVDCSINVLCMWLKESG